MVVFVLGVDSSRCHWAARYLENITEAYFCQFDYLCYNAKHMSKEEKVTLIGSVIEALPDTHFRIELENGMVLIAYMSGKMKYNRIRIYVGDKVEIELDSYGGKPKIIRRK